MNKKVMIFMVMFSIALIVISLYIISTIDQGIKPKATDEFIAFAPANRIKLTEPFNLHVAKGGDFTLESLKDKFTVLYFGFTYCPDICPGTLQKIKSVINSLKPEDLAKIQFVFVSIDPSRDKDKELYYFVDEYAGSPMIGVNGTEQELDKLAISLRAYRAKDAGKEDNYRIDHTSFVYVLNPQAELVMQFTQKASTKTMVEELKQIVQQYNSTNTEAK